MEELKPCPFCGGEAHTRQEVLLDGTHIGHVVYCATCKISVREYRMKQAIEAWNTRAERTCKYVWDEKRRVWYCSECGGLEPCSDIVNYCIYCGAKVVD